MIKLGVIGYGYWGPNLVRNFFSLDSCIVKAVADQRLERLKIAKKYYPSIAVTTNFNDLIKDSTLDAVIVATPVKTHYLLGRKALEAGKHLLLEKPMTSNLNEALYLVNLAKKKRKVIMVDHTYVYKDALGKIKKIIDDREIGKLHYFDSTRTNLGLFQQDTNVLWDLAVHDISLLLYLTKEKPYSLQTAGISHTKNGVENIAYLTIKYRSNFVAHISCSWSSPVKIRLILIGGSKKMIVFNDVEPSEKIRIYDTAYKIKQAVEKSKFVVDYRIGDVHIPKIELKEALEDMAKDFMEAIKTGKKPISDGEHGLEVVKILSLAQESLRNQGKLVYYK